MIVYDKEQKEIVIPNGIGNINLFNNGVEAGYNQGYDQGQADMAAKARVIEITKNGIYQSKYSDSIAPDTVTGVYDDGTEFYNYAELNGDIFNTKIAATVDSRLEFWYKGDNNTAEFYDIIIGAADDKRANSFQIRYYTESKHTLWVEIDDSKIEVNNWSDTVWHHLIVSKAEGLWIDGEKKGDFSPTTNIINGEFYINGAAYDKYHKRTANGSFGMIKIDDVVIIPTADGFLNTNTGELLEVVKKGSYSYPKGELYKTINVNVPDLNGSYVEGYDEGYGRGYAEGETYGANMQKAKLGTITINENGQYEREDGWNVVNVDVPDLNGSYDEGYDQGQADLAAKARVLDVTENGVYKSKYSDPIVPEIVTGVYADGTDFYSYAELNAKVFNTNIAATIDSRLEFWYKGDNTANGAWNTIIGSGNNDNSDCFQVRYYVFYNTWVEISIGNSTKDIQDWDDTVWHHLIVSKAEGLWIDGKKKGDFSPTNTINGEFFINGIGHNADGSRSANGTFGMIKIDDTVIIPTADGFLNTNTGELLEVVKDGSYTFTENLPIYAEGELYKTINVNVVPKVNVKEAGLKFAYSTFTEVPEWADFKDVTDMSYMFDNCTRLETIPLIDTSKVTNMEYMFYTCVSIQTIPLINTSNVTNMGSMFKGCNYLQTIPPLNTSNVRVMNNMFSDCIQLESMPQLDTSNVEEIENMFYRCYKIKTMPALDFRSLSYVPSYKGFFGYYDLSDLTDFGGFLNLKCSLESDNNLKRLPNLTYESCINVLNGLYDFTGNGETPNSNQGKLKVAQSFIDKVGDEISIGINKGWQITV